MKKSMLFVCIALAALAASADVSDPMVACDNGYSSCTGKCDASENASAECYTACDDKYQKCLNVANGYTPEPEENATPVNKNAEKE